MKANESEDKSDETDIEKEDEVDSDADEEELRNPEDDESVDPNRMKRNRRMKDSIEREHQKTALKIK